MVLFDDRRDKSSLSRHYFLPNDTLPCPVIPRPLPPLHSFSHFSFMPTTLFAISNTRVPQTSSMSMMEYAGELSIQNREPTQCQVRNTRIRRGITSRLDCHPTALKGTSAGIHTITYARISTRWSPLTVECGAGRNRGCLLSRYNGLVQRLILGIA